MACKIDNNIDDGKINDDSFKLFKKGGYGQIFTSPDCTNTLFKSLNIGKNDLIRNEHLRDIFVYSTISRVLKNPSYLVSGLRTSLRLTKHEVKIYMKRYNGDLDRLSKKLSNPLNIDLLKNLTYQVLIGLKHLNCIGFHHLDIKPNNILYNRKKNKYEFALTDYSFSVPINSCGHFTLKDNDDEEGRLIYIQTGQYKAPEIRNNCDGLRQGKLTYQSYFKFDIWSIGVMILEYASGGYKFTCSNKLDQISIIRESLLKKTRLAIPDKQFIDLIVKMTEFNPDCRLTVNECLKHPTFNNFKKPLIRIPGWNNVIRLSDLHDSEMESKITSDPDLNWCINTYLIDFFVDYEDIVLIKKYLIKLALLCEKHNVKKKSDEKSAPLDMKLYYFVLMNLIVKHYNHHNLGEHFQDVALDEPREVILEPAIILERFVIACMLKHRVIFD